MMASYKWAGGEHLTGPHCCSEKLMEKNCISLGAYVTRPPFPSQEGWRSRYSFSRLLAFSAGRKETQAFVEDLLCARHWAAPLFPSSQEPCAVWHLSCFCPWGMWGSEQLTVSPGSHSWLKDGVWMETRVQGSCSSCRPIPTPGRSAQQWQCLL